MKRGAGMVCQKITLTSKEGYKSKGKYTKPHPSYDKLSKATVVKKMQGWIRVIDNKEMTLLLPHFLCLAIVHEAFWQV